MQEIDIGSLYADYERRLKALENVNIATSPDFKKGLLKHLSDGAAAGFSGAIIEVGVFTGSTSCLLALAAEQLKVPLFLIDISEKFLGAALDNVSRVTPYKSVFGYVGTFEGFSASIRLRERPLLVFIDGDHRQAAVEADIRALLGLSSRPRFAAFHDFNMRSNGKGRETIGVDRAIEAVIGECPVIRIGTHFRTDLKPNHSGDYYEAGGYEGAVIVLDSVPSICNGKLKEA